MSTRSKLKPSIGWREWVSLPELGIPRIKAKVDTGARSSALHATRITPEHRDGQLWVRFEILPHQRRRNGVVQCAARVLEQRMVRDSGGHENERFVIETHVRLGEQAWPIELTLTSRASMGFRMLLGRTAIRRRYLVDPGRSYLVGDK